MSLSWPINGGDPLENESAPGEGDGDDIDADHINAITDVLGADPADRASAGASASVTTRLATMKSTQASHGSRLNTAETNLTTHGVTLDDHETRVSDNETEIAAHDTRLDLLEGSVTPPPNPTIETDIPATDPDGYTRVYGENFETTNGFLKDNAGGSGGGGRFAYYTIVHGGTSSRNQVANVTVDTVNRIAWLIILS